MDDGDYNMMKIAKAETNIALPALIELFESLWNKQYPDTKWTNDTASVTLFDQKEEELFQKNISRLSKGEKRKKMDKKRQYNSSFKDADWRDCHWDISKLAYVLIDSKIFRLDEADDAGIPISEHVAGIRNIRNRSAHHICSQCSKEHCDNTLTSLSKHIEAFKVFIKVDKYVEMIECIRSEEAPLTQKERYTLQLDLERLKFNNLIYELKEEKLQSELIFSNQICEQKEKTHEERRKTCEVLDRFLAMQAEHEKIVQCLKGQLEDMKFELQDRAKTIHAAPAKEVKFMKDNIEELQDENITLQAEHEKQVKCFKGQLERKNGELLSKSHEIEMIKLAHKVEIQRLMAENGAKRHKEELQNRLSLNYQNIQLTESEISAVVLRRPNKKSSLRRNTYSDEDLASSENSRTHYKNKSKRNALYIQ